MTARSRLLIPAIRELGIKALFQYGAYRIKLRIGSLRRGTQTYHWIDRPLESWLNQTTSQDQALTRRAPFFFENNLGEGLQRFPSDDLEAEADEILAGKFRLFGGPPVPLGSPPHWGKVPLVEASNSVSLDRHWTEYDEENSLDLRLLWEPSRFAWAYTLSRAYQSTGEQRYATGLLDLLTSWLESNPPNRGPHWISGQEAALRIMALTFVWHALEHYLEGFPERAAEIVTALAAHAKRIPATLSYARAQRNNHLLAEAVGLYSVGLLMPWFEQSPDWKRKGRQWLIRALGDQVFDDGGYIQYSTNYQRLALSASLWAARLADIHGEPLPATTLEALGKMTTFLISLTDPQNGTVPNWGHNDGSNILPLSACKHSDYRPILQAASRAFTGAPAFEPGPWDEMSLWLGLLTGDEVEALHIRQTRFPHTGLYLIRGESSDSTIRCARFTARPGHSDQLHMDLRWKGDNIARDGGSYRYTGSGNAYAEAIDHNGIVADGREPMDRAGRFLWLNWSHARYLGRWQAEDGSVQALASEHALREGITHRRSVVHAGGSMWVVLDELLGAEGDTGRHTARLRWGLIDWPWEFDAQRVTLQGEHGPVRLRITPRMDEIALYRAGHRVAGEKLINEDPAMLGWWSPTYGYKEPALTLLAKLEGQLPLRLTSWWRLGEVKPQDLALEWDSLSEDPLMAFLSSDQQR